MTTATLSPVDLVLDRIRARGGPVRQVGKEWQALCPAHDDQHPSLSVGIGHDGRVILTCRSHACAYADVMAALDLDPRDGMVNEDRGPEWGRNATRRHPYYSAAGDLLGWQERQRTGAAKFLPRLPDGTTGSTEQLKATLYNAPALRRDPDDDVWLCEGEHDCDELLLNAGKLATTNPFGARSFTAVHARQLAGRRVTVVLDRDSAGRDRLKVLRDAGLWDHADVTAVLEPPIPYKDVGELLAAGGTLDQLVAVDVSDTPPPQRGTGDPVPVRDPAMFYGILGEIATTAAAGRHTEADPVGILASLLAAVSALIGPGPHVVIGGTRHPLLVWVLLFGTTSTGRKGEATNYAERHLEAAPGLDLNRISASGLSSGEGVIERIRDEVEVKHGKDVEIIGTTDKRLSLGETEFGSVMARAKREGSTLTAILRQLWDGRALSVLNRQALTASSSHVAVIGHITPKEFRVRLSEVDMAGGTFNRFLPLWVDRTHQLPMPVPLPATTLHRQAGHLADAVGRAKSRQEVTFGPAAEEVWTTRMYAELDDTGSEDRAWSEFTRRLPAYARRISALYAALDGRSLVNVADLEAAAALCRYALASARYVLGNTRRDPRVDRVSRAVQEAPDGLSRTQLRDLFGRNLSAATLDAVLATVAEDPDIDVATNTETGGRHATIYRATRYAVARAYAVSPPDPTPLRVTASKRVDTALDPSVVTASNRVPVEAEQDGDGPLPEPPALTDDEAAQLWAQRFAAEPRSDLE